MLYLAIDTESHLLSLTPDHFPEELQQFILLRIGDFPSPLEGERIIPVAVPTPLFEQACACLGIGSVVPPTLALFYRSVLIGYLKHDQSANPARHTVSARKSVPVP